jgi:CheY-like chemotaxis protein
VRQIVTNGLTNAVKYAHPGTFGGPIHVFVSLRDAPLGAAGAVASTSSGVAIEVIDTGPGLRGQTESALFADFGAAVPTTRTGAVGSSGLGLAICNRLAHLLGGVLHVTERGDGWTGTRFALTLPLGGGAEGVGTAHASSGPAGSAEVAQHAVLIGEPGSTSGGCRESGPLPLQSALRHSRRYSAVFPDPRQPASSPGLAEGAHQGDVRGLAVPHAGGDTAAVATDTRGRGAVMPQHTSETHAVAGLGMRVLLVDDSAGNRRVGARMLSALGCICVTANDGDEVGTNFDIVYIVPFNLATVRLYLMLDDSWFCSGLSRSFIPIF